MAAGLGPCRPQGPCPGDADGAFGGGGGGGGGYYCGGGGASPSGSGGGGGGPSYGPAAAVYLVVSQDPSVTITYQTAFRLAPASRSSLTLDGVGGVVTQQVPSGASSQLWRLVPQGSLYQIVNLASGDCMTTAGSGSTAAGGVTDAWPYNGGYANQYFLTFPG